MKSKNEPPRREDTKNDIKRKTSCLRVFVVTLAFVLGLSTTFAADIPLAERKAYDVDRTDWMKGKWGVMTHYLLAWQSRENHLPATAEQWNKMVDAFDVEALAEQIKSTGASYHVLTIGQNTTHLCTPSPLYDQLFVDGPSNCSRRDLISDMADALRKRGLKLIVYTTVGPGGGTRKYPDPATHDIGEYRNKQRLLIWEKVITQWSSRWGNKVSGWWLDGCYNPNRDYDYPDAPNFQSLAGACRAGNPIAAVAFNRGVMDRPVTITPFADYTAGEINDLQTVRLWRAVDGKVDGARIHLLSYLGQKWGIGQPRYPDLNEIVIPKTIDVLQAGGAMTWDTPIQPTGLIADAYVAQLKTLGQAVAAAPKRKPATTRANSEP